ncbi:MAG: polysaccharide deacetylase family protein [Bacteroidaceae bacterium]|nr:polysaccharide deacetylase family protein [Bacteroidaceae bacterium]
MKKLLTFILFFCLPLLAMAQIQWPAGKKAAIMLTYDDGLQSQLQNVVPALNEHNFKGTFFLMGYYLDAKDLSQWREVSQQGHELGNHSIYHPCNEAQADTLSSHCRALNCYTVEEMLNEIKIMNTFLSAIDGKSQHSYAYPCGQYKAGGHDYGTPMISQGICTFARMSDSEEVITSPSQLMPNNVPSFTALPGYKAEQLTSYIEKVLASGGAGVILFHGIGGDWISVDVEEHQKMIDFLASHSEIWVGTFSDVLSYIQQQK